jgi:hypothetical protein
MKYSDPHALCARCGHQAREHRPDCGHCDSAGRFCRCKEFKAAAAPATVPAEPDPNQLEMVIPGAAEIDKEADANRARIVQELARKQPVERAQRAFSAPEGPLFTMFTQQE